MVSSIGGGSLNPTPPLNPAPPVAGALSDSSIEQLSQTLITGFSDQPRLSISQYHAGVSEAVRLNQVADIISRFEDGEVRRALFLEAINQAIAFAALAAKAKEYSALARQYVNLNLQNEYTLLLAQSGVLQSNITSSGAYMGVANAVVAYNAALNSFDIYLPTYTSALNAYDTAVADFDTALQTWNAALETFNAIASPTPDDVNDLINASSTFHDARIIFVNAETIFGAAADLMELFQNQVDSAQSTLSVAKGVYDSYIAGLAPQIASYNNAVTDWNTAAAESNVILEQMNLLAADLNLIQLPLNLIIAPAAFNFTTPTLAPNPAKATALGVSATVQANVDDVNVYILTPLNPNIVQATLKVSPQIPPFSVLPGITDAAVLTGNADEFPTIPPFILNLPLPALTTPAIPDPTVNIPTINSLAELANGIAAINEQDDSTNDSPLARINRRAATDVTTGGSGSSTQLTNISPLAQAQNPFLNSTLSKQAFESIFNIYGVPAGSALVDQLSASISTLTEASGILSTPLAQDLITTSSVNTNNQDTGVRFVLSLANLTGLSSLIQDGTLRASLAQIMREDASFQALQSEEQDALLDALTQEVGATLLKAALAYISQQFGMPGLIAQLLVAAAGTGDGDALGSIQSQLYFASTLADRLQSNLGISSDVANTIANQALANGTDDDVGIQQSLSQIISDQGLSALSEDEVNNQIGQSLAETRDIVNDTVANQEQAQKQAFADSLTSSLLGQGILDQTQAARITQELLDATLAETNEIALRILRGFNLDQEELQRILAEAEQAKTALDGSVNPIAAINSNAEATPTSLQTGFEDLARQILAPAVGDAQALQIAGDYGRLIFSSPNSILARLQSNESSLRTQSSYDFSARLADDYQTYTADLRNPTTATGNPLQLGETLLLSANMGGPSTAGTTSLDNQLGVFANTHINPSGILG